MATVTCTVCGAAEAPAGDHTCPACGADLPVIPVTPQQDPEAPGAPEAQEGQEATAAPDEAADAGDSPGQPPPPPPPSWPTGDTSVPPPPTSPPPTSPPGGPMPPVPVATPDDPTHPSGLSNSLRTFGMLTHLSAFAGALIALAFIGPLVMWLIRRDEHPFLDHHGKEALNFNLSMLLYGVIGIVVSIATLGLGLVIVVPATVVFFVTWVVATIVAAVKANAGEGYRYPLTIRFVKD